MKYLVGFTFAVALTLATGCAGHHNTSAHAPAPTPPVAAPTPPVAAQPILTPDTSLAATVLVYNPVNRFVVLNFPFGRLPKVGQILFLYHSGLKAGEVKITGPAYDDNVVADLTSGTAQSGDEVRDQ